MPECISKCHMYQQRPMGLLALVYDIFSNTAQHYDINFEVRGSIPCGKFKSLLAFLVIMFTVGLDLTIQQSYYLVDPSLRQGH